MLKTIKLLTMLLAVQIVLALGLNFTDRELSARTDAGPLIEVDNNQVNRVTLEGMDQEKVVLARREGDWKIPELDDFPADSNRVKQLLDRLAALQAGTPVATTSGAQERFKVSDDNFERRITLARGDETVARLYLGSSPGVRRIHARADGQQGIHSVKMAAYDVSVKSSGWEDKSVLKLPKEKISAIEIDGLRLERGSSSEITVAKENATEQTDAVIPSVAWKAGGLQDNQELNPGAADKLAGILAGLRFERVLGRENKVEYGLGSPHLQLALSVTDGVSLTYRLAKSQDGEEYTLKVSNRPEFFRLAGYTAKPLLEAAERSRLLSSASPGSAENGSEQTPE